MTYVGFVKEDLDPNIALDFLYETAASGWPWFFFVFVFRSEHRDLADIQQPVFMGTYANCLDDIDPEVRGGWSILLAFALFSHCGALQGLPGL